MAHVVAALVSELQGYAEEQDEFDATRALSRILRHGQHVGTVVAGGTVAALTRVRLCTESQRVKSETTHVLNMISEAERSPHSDKAQTPT